MSIFDKIREWFWQPMMGTKYVEHRQDVKLRRDYRKGRQRLPLKDQDDSVIVNFVGLIVDRSVSMLFGKPIIFDLPGDNDTAEQIYIDNVWKANRQEHLLKSLALYGSESGTCYVKILPDGTLDKDGKEVPRLVALDPSSMIMDTKPDDHSDVFRYTIAYAVYDEETDEERMFKQVIERQDSGFWLISDYHADSGGRWISDGPDKLWEYTFSPVRHWQNITENGSPYGRPDVTDDIIDLQDKFNFVVSNTAKIIKFHAHPKTWGRNFGRMQNALWGPDDMILSDNENAMLQNLEMQSDLGSSLNYIKFLRQALFDVARTVDIDSLADKLGALTNFGLRVLYQDAMSKLDDKRGSYGEALIEINHILLELAGMNETDGGEIVWPDVLPVNEIEQTTALKADRELGLVSKQTAATERGYNWIDEEERLGEEQVAGDNVGAQILRAFGRGE